MKVLDGSWTDWAPVPGAKAVTIGVLDGVHLGHRSLLAHLDDSLVRTVLTFEPHPVEVLRPGTVARLLTTIDERLGLFETLGIDLVGILDLGEIKEQTPDRFVRDVLVGKIGVGQLVVGADFRFGKDRTGDVRLLRGLGHELGFDVDPVELVADGVQTVSSSRIRSLVGDGRVGEAARLMGSRLTITNIVVEGDRRGSELGFPTANIMPPDRKIIPGAGVYSCFASVGGVGYEAAVNVGTRPTFGGGSLVIEAFLLDFDTDIYGEPLTVEFVEYLRPELKFDDVATLVAQMREDVARTRVVLESAQTRV